MPFTMPNFQIMQGNPFVQGALQGTQAVQNIRDAQRIALANQLSKIQMPYAQPMAQANLLKAQLFNEMYKPDIQSQINNRNASSGLLGQQTKYYGRGKEAEIAQQLADVNYKNKLAQIEALKAKYPGLMGGQSAQDIALAMMTNQGASNQAPQQMQQGYEQPINAQIESMNNPNIQNGTNPLSGGQNQSQLSQMLSKLQPGKTPENAVARQMPSELQQQPNEGNLYNQLANADVTKEKAMASYYNMGGGRGGVDLQLMRGLQNQLMQEHPEWDSNTALQAVSSYLQGSDTLPNGQQLPSPTGADSQLLGVLSKRPLTAAQINQQMGARKVDTLLGQAQTIMPDVTKFAGTMGKLKLTSDQLGAQLGTDDPEYLNFLKFKNQILPLLMTPMIAVEGGHATDQQKKWMAEVADPVFWDRNPEQALKLFNNLNNIFKGYLSPLTAENATQRIKALKEGAKSPSPLQNALSNKSQKDLVYNPQTGELS